MKIKEGSFDKLSTEDKNCNEIVRPSISYWGSVWKGARVSMFVGIVGAILDVVIGSLYGGIAGYFGGVVDSILMRIIEVISAVPFIMVAVLLALVMKPGITTIILVSILVGWTGTARIIRGQIMQIKNAEYVMAAKSLGASGLRIILSHILPNSIGIILTNLCMDISYYIFAEAGISFMGIGVQSPDISLGMLVAYGEECLSTQPYQFFIPCLVLLDIVLVFNVIGDSLRNALDPKLE